MSLPQRACALHFTSILAYIISPLGVDEERVRERTRGGKVRLERKGVKGGEEIGDGRGQEDTCRDRKRREEKG